MLSVKEIGKVLLIMSPIIVIVVFAFLMETYAQPKPEDIIKQDSVIIMHGWERDDDPYVLLPFIIL